MAKTLGMLGHLLRLVIGDQRGCILTDTGENADAGTDKASQHDGHHAALHLLDRRQEGHFSNFNLLFFFAEVAALVQDLTDREQTHRQSSGVQSVHQLPVTKSQALYAGNRVNAEAAQHNADQRANQTLEQIVRRHGDDHRQTHQGHGEILPVTEDQGDLRQLRCQEEQGQGGECTADQGGENADRQRGTRFAAFSHGITVIAGKDRRRGARDIDQGRRDQAAADTAHVNCHQQSQALHRSHGISEGDHQSHAQNGRQSGNTSENNSHKDAKKQQCDRKRVAKNSLKANNHCFHGFSLLSYSRNLQGAQGPAANCAKSINDTENLFCEIRLTSFPRRREPDPRPSR